MAKRKIIDGAFLSALDAVSLNVHKPVNGYMGGNHKSKSYGSSIEFADFREYTPGDDIRRIDWNLYARIEKFYTKLWIDERQMHNHVFIDTSASMESGEPLKSDMALKLAMAVGYMTLRDMDRVSFFQLKNDKCTDVCGTVMGREGVYTTAEKLNTVDFSEDTDMEKAVKSCMTPGYANGISVIISDFFTESDWKAAVEYLLYLKREVVLIQVVSPQELNPEIDGKAFLLDSEALDIEDERNVKFDIDRSAIKAYYAALKYHADDMKKFCISREIPLITVRSDESIETIMYKKGLEAGLVK
ncbi:MAG: DUF58 domain-containing protein [Ruminococcaceae bacterium]|nr:DUF58 domain-containing protein [Oscillospiraceae bacterium]